jgi:CheY-like chemotaxis protein
MSVDTLLREPEFTVPAYLQEHQASEAKPLNVIVAEQDPGNARFLRQVLGPTKIGLVDHIPDGRRLLKHLEETARWAAKGERPLPDILLLDIHLPLVSGYEVLARMPRMSSLRTFLVTGQLREFDRLRAQSPDVHGLLAKPISLGHVAEILDYFPRHARLGSPSMTGGTVRVA